MNKKPIKVLSKNRFTIFLSFFTLFLLIDTLFGLNVIVKLKNDWHESTVGFIFVFLSTVLTIGLFNSFISRIYLYSDFILMRTLFSKRKIYYHNLKELHFNSSGPSPNNHYFALYGDGATPLGIINTQYLGKLNKQKDFINLIKKQQPTIKLDRNCERLVES